jgi:hypothetical protein
MSERIGLTNGASHRLHQLAVWDPPWMPRYCHLTLLPAMFLAVPAWPQQEPPDLTERSIEDLMNIEVTSVLKKEEKLSRTAAAIFIITAEDIQWTLSLGFSYPQLHLHDLRMSTDNTSVASLEGSGPREQAQSRSHVELRSRWAVDTSVYFVARLATLQVLSHTRPDCSLTWHALEELSFSVVGQNLFQGNHLEFSSPSQPALSSLVKRNAHAKSIWRF